MDYNKVREGPTDIQEYNCYGHYLQIYTYIKDRHASVALKNGMYLVYFYSTKQFKYHKNAFTFQYIISHGHCIISTHQYKCLTNTYNTMK